jgi:hypothetical protein
MPMFILLFSIHLRIQVQIIHLKTILVNKIYIFLGKVFLQTSRTHRDPFEKGHQDEFHVELTELGPPTKIKYEHILISCQMKSSII